VTTINNIDLKDSPVAVINYWTKFNTENCYDFVEMQVSVNNGPFVAQREGIRKMLPSMKTPAILFYDGRQSAWVYEEVVLDNVANNDIRIRFNLVSDGATRADGYYFDDVTVNIIDMNYIRYPGEQGHSCIYFGSCAESGPTGRDDLIPSPGCRLYEIYPL